MYEKQLVIPGKSITCFVIKKLISLFNLLTISCKVLNRDIFCLQLIDIL